MSTNDATRLTLLDVTKRTNPDQTAAQVVELLSQQNEMLDDIPFVEGNLPTGNQTTMRTELPDVWFRTLNKGVPGSKSTTAQIVDTCGIIEGFSEVDEEVLAINGMAAAYRTGEDNSFVEAMNQKFMNAFIYGNAVTDPEQWNGLAPRYDDINDAAIADFMIDAGGSGSTDNTSIWLVGWSPDKVAGIYPRGQMGGLKVEDLGRRVTTDASGNKMMVWTSHFIWKAGVMVRDYRYVVRIHSIDVSDLTYNAATGARLQDLMVQALERLQGLVGVTPVFYCNRRIRSTLRRQLLQANNLQLSWEQLAGRRTLMFGEAAVRLNDAILNTEISY